MKKNRIFQLLPNLYKYVTIRYAAVLSNTPSHIPHGYPYSPTGSGDAAMQAGVCKLSFLRETKMSKKLSFALATAFIAGTTTMIFVASTAQACGLCGGGVN